MTTADSAGELIVGLLELDTAPRASWVFPALGDQNVDVLAARAQLAEGVPIGSSPVFAFSRSNDLWFFTLARDRKPPGEADVVHAAVSRFAIFLGSSIFDPERYEALLRVLLRAFEAEGGSPLALLQRVLSVHTKGSASAPGGSDFVASRFDAAAARVACPFTAVLRSVGVEGAATLWGAMLLKARIVRPRRPRPLAAVRTLPLFAWHRARWEACGRSAPSPPSELDDLKGAGTFVAGFLDGDIAERAELMTSCSMSRAARCASRPARRSWRRRPRSQGDRRRAQEGLAAAAGGEAAPAADARHRGRPLRLTVRSARARGRRRRRRGRGRRGGRRVPGAAHRGGGDGGVGLGWHAAGCSYARGLSRGLRCGARPQRAQARARVRVDFNECA